jgi:hypothetical protein
MMSSTSVLSKTLSKHEVPMDQQSEQKNSDATADALSAVAIVLIPVVGVIYWLSGMPS